MTENKEWVSLSPYLRGKPIKVGTVLKKRDSESYMLIHKIARNNSTFFYYSYDLETSKWDYVGQAHFAPWIYDWNVIDASEVPFKPNDTNRLMVVG